ncbi:MAG: sodium:proton antiporter, partial [Bacteroidales bacterium]|nr:sodium:proton antiporter [Bacteroidales bacterium]
MTKKISLPICQILICLFIVFSFQFIPKSIYGQEQSHNTDTTIIHQHAENTEHITQHEEGGHTSNLNPLFFLIIALIIGAATRHLFKKAPIPYTVLLLIIGLGLGLLARLGLLGNWNLGFLKIDVSFISDSISWAGNIDPHMVLFVFLPILIFDAAFALDVHTFKKIFTNATLLAVPGILIALFITALVIILIKISGIGLSAWTWTMALMFGAVVSATDPVAVTAILKELGASKKLGTLIEGESMLNDGTAIVFFMVFFAGFTGVGGENSALYEFFKVSLGGALVGLTIAWITIMWVKKVFNDALVEISILIAAAYITFFIAEHFFHVSGVIGLVTFGIMMAGVGRTRLSPQVEHFLHEFWELFAFIANTLIFIIVGVVIANRVVFTGTDFLILILIYIGVHIARVAVIAFLYPVMRKSGYGLKVKDSYVLWWGALRGGIA